MRVSALRLAFSPRVAAAASLLAAISLLGACDGLIKKTADACSVSVAPLDVTIPVNASQTIVGTAYDCDGNSIPKRPPTFSSANPLIASVTASGVIIGVAPGVTKVSAVASGKSAEVNVTVSPERAGTVSVTPASITLRRTNVRQFTSVVKNAAGTVITGSSIVWASSNSSIVSVDNTGMVTALSVGNATVSASADGQTGTSFVTVTEVPIGACTIAPTTQDILVNKQATFTLALRDTASPSNPLSTTGRAITWSSDNEVFATVTGTSNGTGLVTAKKAGSVTITATSTENTSISCRATAVVKDPKIVTVQIAPIGAVLRLGVPRQYSVTLFDADQVVIPNTGRTITWKSLTPTIAIVNGAGLVVPNALTTTSPGRIAVDAEGAVDTATFTVKEIPIASITVAPLSSTVVEGQSKQLTATVTDSVGNVVTNRVLEWISSDGTKATVSNTGLVTSFGAGTVSITANAESRTGTATVIIQPSPIDTIVVVQNTFSLAKGTTSPFSIVLRDAAGVQRRNRTVTVTSDQPSIATGTADAAATQVNVTGVNLGTATLTIQALDANGVNQGKATKVVVTVTSP